MDLMCRKQLILLLILNHMNLICYLSFSQTLSLHKTSPPQVPSDLSVIYNNKQPFEDPEVKK